MAAHIHHIEVYSMKNVNQVVSVYQKCVWVLWKYESKVVCVLWKVGVGRGCVLLMCSLSQPPTA